MAVESCVQTFQPFAKLPVERATTLTSHEKKHREFWQMQLHSLSGAPYLRQKVSLGSRALTLRVSILLCISASSRAITCRLHPKTLFYAADMQANSEYYPRANVLGIGIHAVDMRAALTIVRDAINQRRKGYICMAGVHGVMEAQRDAALRQIFTQALLVAPDGMPTVWMGRLQGLRRMRRVFGPAFMLAVMSDPALSQSRHFLCGGSEGVARQLELALRSRFPQLHIVGTYTPPFRRLTTTEANDLCKRLDLLRPDITWVGLSTPKQDYFMAEYLNRLNTTLMVGVGAAFDFHTGRLKDSPEWIKTLGLQWVHRLAQEPRRLWKRYLINNPRFLAHAFLQLTNVRRYGLPS